MMHERLFLATCSFGAQSREHQVAAWKSHKALCKQYQEIDEAEGIRATLGQLTDHQIVDNLLEDFVHLHESTFDELANCIYHDNTAKMQVIAYKN